MKSDIFVLLILVTLVTITSASGLTSGLFESEASHEVTQYEEVTSATTELTCVRDCVTHSSCDSCAFETERGECFLQVESHASHGGTSRVYRLAPLCNQSEAVNFTTARVSWRMPGLVGDIHCNNDFMYIGDNPTVYCSSDEEWIKDGSCVQRIWRNPQNVTSVSRFDFPRAISPGWAMCVRGLACQSCDRFSLNLKDDGGRYLSHMDVRFDFFGKKRFVKKLAFNANLDNKWLNMTVLDVFPFAHGQPFEVELRLLSLKELQVSVSKTVVFTYTAPVSVTQATHFNVSNGEFVALHFVDVWAGCH